MDGSCHCGAVRVTVPWAPERVTSCNCSICRRLGTLWAYYPHEQVTMTPADGTDTYVWGDGRIAFHRCKVCGCTVRWTDTAPEPQRTGVNARLMDELDWSMVTLSRLDGADTWEHQEEAPSAGRYPYRYFR